MNNITRFSLIISMSVFFLSGCMLGPTDEQELESRESEIHFTGYTLTANQAVSLWAYNWQTSSYDPIDTATTSGSAQTYLGSQLYPWTFDTTLVNNDHWKSGLISGYRARVKASVDSGSLGTTQLISVESDWAICFGDVRSVIEFSNQCASDSTPGANLYTNDYCDERPNIGRENFTRIFFQAHCENEAYVDLELGSVAPGRYRNLSVELWRDANRPVLESESKVYPCRVASTGKISCRIPFGSTELFESLADLDSSDGFYAELVAEDPSPENCITTTNSLRFGESSWANEPIRTCSMPEPTPPEGTWHSVDCVCLDVGGTIADVNVRACLNGSASNPAIGAGLVCQITATQLEAAGRLNTQCELRQFTETGGSCAAISGNQSIQSIEER